MMIERLIPGFRPETAVERALAGDPRLLAGLAWGRPRPGHPEGSVGLHVAEILAAITEPAGRRRRELRFLALVHDGCKRQVPRAARRSPDNDHAVLARRFAERYTTDPRMLDALELHDEPYRIWRAGEENRDELLRDVLARIPDVDLFLRFVELDGSTRGKDPRPLAWLGCLASARPGSSSPSPSGSSSVRINRSYARASSACSRTAATRSSASRLTPRT
jgi:hypothetical protein